MFIKYILTVFIPVSNIRYAVLMFYAILNLFDAMFTRVLKDKLYNTSRSYDDNKQCQTNYFKCISDVGTRNIFK